MIKAAPIEIQWMASAENLHIKPEMGVQYTEMRKAFYAGVSSLLVEFETKIAEMPEELGVIQLETWKREVQEFWEDEVRRWKEEKEKNE